ncbi:iron donor protein CyaY [Candidatus Tisiphia endosymbiont of Sialis lutaria]|uniref:iron donor protein CyaY n=1 Tax=Candidatus Tisiphia endosymbiont of Sialis lutaria TaxID=2029164 RepID=UPI00312CBF05
MDNTEFAKLAEQTISLIAEIIETEDKDCLIDIDFQGDILTLTTNQGIFVINKHSAAKEIWLSSPISGPYHFYYTTGIANSGEFGTRSNGAMSISNRRSDDVTNFSRWQSKSSDDLIDILQQELKINFKNTSKT